MTSTLSLGKCQCLKQRIQMLLSRKLEKFSKLFSELLKSTSNFEHFDSKNEPHS